MRQWAIVLPPTPRPVIPCLPLPLPAPANGTGTHLGARGPAARDAVITRALAGKCRKRGTRTTGRTSDSYIEEDDLSEN